FEAAYRILVNLIDCPDPRQPCASAGRVRVSGCGEFDRAGSCYVSAGSTVNVQAFPNDGFVFTNWAQVAGSIGRPTAFAFSGAITEPWVLAPQFQPAVGLKVSVNIATIPPRMRILADRTPYGPPIDSNCADYPPQVPASSRACVVLEWGRGT